MSLHLAPTCFAYFITCFIVISTIVIKLSSLLISPVHLLAFTCFHHRCPLLPPCSGLVAFTCFCHCCLLPHAYFPLVFTIVVVPTCLLSPSSLAPTNLLLPSFAITTYLLSFVCFCHHVPCLLPLVSLHEHLFCCLFV